MKMKKINNNFRNIKSSQYQVSTIIRKKERKLIEPTFIDLLFLLKKDGQIIFGAIKIKSKTIPKTMMMIVVD